jgi:hypothetical protein
VSCTIGQDSLIHFVEGAWPSLDPTDYQPCWAIDALCEHLQAVAYGHIKRLLLVNFPPAVRQDAGDIGVLPSMDMGAVWATVAQRTAGSISLRQLQ